jgi:NAD(P)-dependent dehydrogenase (short-subunit alcohol dehydrogenase family)
MLIFLILRFFEPVVQDSATSGRSWPYLYSKSALGHATASLAHELLPLGIRVNGIAPGAPQS